MKQILFGKSYGNVGTAPLWIPLRGYQWDVDTDNSHTHPWSVAGTFKFAYFEILAPVENAAVDMAWDQTTFYLVKNGVDTGLTVTVPAMGPIAQNGFQASGQNILDSVHVDPGDILNLRRTPGTLHGNTNAAYANINWSLTFESDNPGESSYGSGSASQKVNPASSVFWCPPLNCNMTAWQAVGAPDTIDSVLAHSIVPLYGSLYRADFNTNTAPGASSFTIFAYKNGVKQDGSGGTVNTAMTITGAATKFVFLFDLPLVPLDWLSFHIDPAFTTGSFNDYITVSVGVRATTDGQSAVCFNSAGGQPIVDGSTDWVGSEGSGWAWSTQNSPTPSPAWRPSRYPSTELLVSYPGAIDPFTLSGLCVNLDHFPGAAKSYLFTTRKAFADTLATVTMAGNVDPNSRLFTDPLAGTASYATVADRFNLQAVASGTPTAAHVGWTWLMTTPTTPPPIPPPNGCPANLGLLPVQGPNGCADQV